jgi:hypothetical protein
MRLGDRSQINGHLGFLVNAVLDERSSDDRGLPDDTFSRDPLGKYKVADQHVEDCFDFDEGESEAAVELSGKISGESLHDILSVTYMQARGPPKRAGSDDPLLVPQDRSS